MATPKHDPEYEVKKQRVKELIAAGGCYAIQYWSHTDALRLCPREHNQLEIQLEAPIYISEWIAAGKMAIELIQKGIDILEVSEYKMCRDILQRLVDVSKENSMPAPFKMLALYREAEEFLSKHQHL